MNPDAAMPAAGKIIVRANGQDYETAFGGTLDAFVQERSLALARVVVELNGEALSPSEARLVRLKSGDKLEIVRIVAGG
jgi:thiamine biosynthesis protein ThiS